MIPKITSVFFQRKVLFLLAFILLLLALAHRPWMLLSMFSAKGLTNAVILVVVGLITVITVHELVHCVLRSRSGSRIGRRWTFFFLLVGLVGINALLTVLDNLACKTFGIGPFLSSNAAMYMLTAIELMWMALLE